VPVTSTTPPSADLERRLRTYPWFVLAALVGAFAFTVLTADGSTTQAGRLGGDFPAFYSAGSIVADGQVESLYELQTQAAAQADLLGAEDGFVMYPYAPHVAAAYAPLSQLSYTAAYVLHTTIMVAALVSALWVLRPVIGILDRRFVVALTAAVTAYPVFVGVMGGQNTAISLLLVAAAWRAWHDDNDALAGLALAVLLFRPQYALPLIGLALLDRRYRTVAVAALGAVGVWLANAAVAGASWVTFWYDGVRPLLEADAEVNAVNEIAPIGVTVALFGETTFAVLLGGAVSAALVMGLMWLWWTRPADLTARMAITAAALPLLGPHAIYYDAALLVFTVLVLIDRDKLTPLGAAAIWLATLVHVSRFALDVSPLILVIGAVLIVAGQRLVSGQAEADRVLPIHDS